MATGTSIFLIAVGAILTFAVDVSVAGLDLAAVGVILMIVGAVGIAISLFWLDRTSTPSGTSHRVVEERRDLDPSSGTRRIVEERRII